MKEILKTDNLCKYFKKQKAVDNVSITVRENSIYGLLGPNGAGKSTTLKMITGMLRPTSGKVLFNGHEWNRKDLEQMQELEYCQLQMKLPKCLGRLLRIGPNTK